MKKLLMMFTNITKYIYNFVVASHEENLHIQTRKVEINSINGPFCGHVTYMYIKIFLLPKYT